MIGTLRNIHRATIATVAFVIWSCGGSASTDVTPEVAAVVITPPASTLSLNSTLALQAAVQDAAGGVISSLPVLWTVRDPSVATVSETGVVTAKSLGTTQVAASSGGKSGIATITVQKTPVASVSVRPNRVDGVVGSRTQLTGTAYDAAGNVLADRAIVWTSSNVGVATVDATGLVVALAAGTVTVTGASEGKSDAAVVNLVQGAIASVTVTPNPVSMVAGQSTQLAASPRDANGTVVTGRAVIWSSSNTAIASVASDGVVKAVGAGSTTITATIDGVSGTSTVTVSNVPVASVSVAPQGPSLAVGASAQLTATTKDANDAILLNRTVVWMSSNTAIATVSTTGVLTAVSPGTASITATSESKSGSTIVTVTLVPVGSVTVAPPTVSLTTLQTRALTATVADANGTVLTGRPVVWSSSNDLIATVSQAGVVTGVLPGSVTITAASGGKSGTSAVTVTLVPVASVSVAPTSRPLTVGQTGTFTATVTDANGTVVTNRPVTWSSSSSAVTVTQTGVATAVAPGTATITATSESVGGTATVVVTSAPVGSVTVTPATSTLVAGGGTTLTAVVKDAGGVVVSGAPVAWSSSNTQVAAVSATGAVTTSLAGTATITATSGSQSGTATIIVNPGATATVTVSPKTGSVKANGPIGQLTATAVDSKGNVITGRTFVWSSSSTSIATVTAGNPSSFGNVAGKRTGTVTITVSLEGKSDTALVTVIN